jgi:hypothetical protein
MMKLKKKSIKKGKKKKQLESTQVNPLSNILGSWDWNNIIQNKQNKSSNLILNQPNIK